MTLIGVVEVIVGLLAGGVGALLVFGFLFVAFVSVAELAGKAWQRLWRGRSLQLEQYRAEQALYAIRREAVHDMLETARTQRYPDDPNVIEGTAVEVTR